MRLARTLVFLVFAFSPGFLLLAQQTQSSATTAPVTSQDPQAVSVLNQALTVGGGITAIKALADYTGSGNITYHWDQDVQGNVTAQGLGFDDFRLDANLPSGRRSWTIHNGQTALRAENGNISKFPPDGLVPSSDAFPYQTPLFPSSLVFPYQQLVAILNSPQFSIFYRGITQLDGRSAHDVQVQLALAPGQVDDPMSEYHTKDLFIDTSTFQLLMTQDSVPKHVIHQVLYSAYTAVNGVLVPFSISEELEGQHTWDIQLTQIHFNSGLQDSGFVLQ
jgi:hypothetical protein